MPAKRRHVTCRRSSVSVHTRVCNNATVGFIWFFSCDATAKGDATTGWKHVAVNTGDSTRSDKSLATTPQTWREEPVLCQPKVEQPSSSGKQRSRPLFFYGAAVTE